MISELRVREVATIADVTLELGPGLNVLSGETGAGKSMLVDALALLAGARAESGLVRPGAQRAVVEGSLEVDASLVRDLEALGIEADEGRVVVKRELSAEGRSRAWINGSPVTVATLAALGARLVDLHGQHEALSLLSPSAQRDLLDDFAGAAEERRLVEAAYEAREALVRDEASLAARRDEVRRRQDYLRHVVAEIDRAQLRDGEDATLDVEIRRLGQATDLAAQAGHIADAVGDGDGGALDALARADRALTALERVEPAAPVWRELLDAAWANLDELARLASRYATEVQDDPARLAELQRRRDLLFGLFQKYGADVAAVLQARAAAAGELDLLDTADLDLASLGKRRAAADVELGRAAAALTARRAAAAERLSRGVTRWLPRLGMPGATFRVGLVPEAVCGRDGAESVTYLVRLNSGMDERPLARVASGGELARVMLALKAVLARHDRVPTLVFDEVDQGIGGEVGAQVGEALAEVAQRHQVFVVTHLPQVAARAARHLAVSKVARRGIATSDVATLLGEDRVLELARMLGDADSATALRHARALLDEAGQGTSRPARR